MATILIIGDESEGLKAGLAGKGHELLTAASEEEALAMLSIRTDTHPLAERNIQLAELHRFKDEMAALLVHDLKNPLAVMLSNYRYIAEGIEGKPDPSFREALEDSQAAGNRILRLLSNLMDLTRMESSRLEPRRTPVDPVALLRAVVEPRHRLAEARRISLVPGVIAQGTPKVMVDADLVGRALENLVDNAMRYTPAGGRVELTAARAGDRVVLRIGNTGPAIPADARAMIFEKYGQAHPSAGRMNLGLGLYFCRLVAEAHGGRITVEETESLPTVFAVELPAA